ncbi:MAG TPA: di-heme oxidoredictase family protein [Candidatus Limnocylindrales bacterium]|nr:di-heme oxidoredictase family protein [Candidatus Limnocylindrales bacterium]
MPQPGSTTSLRARRAASAAVLACVFAGMVAASAWRVQLSAAASVATGRAPLFSTEHLPVPDEPLLREQLEDAVELRRREDYDRTLDARDPGELIEHATLNEIDFDRRTLGIDTLFVVGDELFGYLFRPENGWGRGSVDRTAAGFTPQLNRIHDGASGGPDAFGCFSCHSKGGPDGAGTQSQNAFLHGNGKGLGGADQRNPPHLLGLGPVALLAREMSEELRDQAATARERARGEGRDVEHALSAKGVAFGRITARADGTIDTSSVDGVDGDLTIKPFGWKGHHATLRGIVEESLHIHQGLLSKRIQLAVRDEGLDAAPYGKGRWDDVDEDGVLLEIDSAMVTTVVGYLAQLEAPVTRPPRDPGLLDAFAQGRAQFESVGCAHCHVPTLELADASFDVREKLDAERPTFLIDVAKDGETPKIEPEYAREDTSYLVHLFSDLKRHDMGEALATPGPQGTIGARMFLTRPLWGLAETAPYLHDGRAPTVHDAIVLHGGAAAGARDAYLALGEGERASVRVFLTSLSRKPKLFVP